MKKLNSLEYNAHNQRSIWRFYETPADRQRAIVMLRRRYPELNYINTWLDVSGYALHLGIMYEASKE